MLKKKLKYESLGLGLEVNSNQVDEHLWKHYLRLSFLNFHIVRVIWRTGNDNNNVRNYQQFWVKWFNLEAKDDAGQVID